MGFLDLIRVAFKNLARQKVRSVLTIVAITVGSLSLILMASLIISIRQSLVDQFQELGAFSLVSVIKDPNSVRTDTLLGQNGDPSEGKMIDEAAFQQLRNLPHVADATPVLMTNVKTMRLEGGDRKTWGNIMGYNPFNDVFEVDIAYGRKLRAGDMDKIVIGSRFLEEIKYKGAPADLIGKNVLLAFQYGPNNAPDWGPIPEKPPENADKEWYEARNNQVTEIPVEIVGIMAGGVLDSGQSYITLEWAKRLAVRVSWEWPEFTKEMEQEEQRLRQEAEARGIRNWEPSRPAQQLVKTDEFARQGYAMAMLKVDDQANIDALADEVEKLGYGTNTAKAMLDEINKILTGIGAILAIIGGISLFVASIGIINTMIMATYERTREIGVMRACGATQGAIRSLFTFEAGMLGFWGGTIALLIALGLGQLARYIIGNFDTSLSAMPLDRIGEFPWWLIAAVIGFTTLLGMLAGLYPAIRASRKDPVEALRYE